jgi:hypothetical protein
MESDSSIPPEYLKQQEEERKKYQAYIDRRRKEVQTKQAGVLTKLNQNLVEKYTIK